MSSNRQGPPKHQNRYAWNPNANHKKNETELGGKLRPYSDITGVCPRCRDQIEWKRRYGKYKPLVEPGKCQKCGKRAVRQAYHNLCFGKFIPWCAKDSGVCAKCSCRVDRIVGRDTVEVEAERKTLEEAIKNARERDRRTLLRAMNKQKAGSAEGTPKGGNSKMGQLFPAASIDEYANLNREDKNDDMDENDDEDNICD